MEQFKDKVVLISGASSGIGACTAIEFAKQRAKMVLTGRNEENLRKTFNSCLQAGTPEDHVIFFVADLTKEEECRMFVDKAVNHFGRIDVLVNNAGRMLAGNIDKCTVEDLDLMYNTNVRSMFIITKQAIPHLEKTKGCIVNMSSLAGDRPIPYATAYAMSKASVSHFTKILAQDLASRGIRVNCVSPGVIETDLFIRDGAFCAGKPEMMPEFYKRAASTHPLQRIGQSKDVASAILYLSSDAASYITGMIMPVDGGRNGSCSNHRN